MKIAFYEVKRKRCDIFRTRILCDRANLLEQKVQHQSNETAIRYFSLKHFYLCQISFILSSVNSTDAS